MHLPCCQKQLKSKLKSKQANPGPRDSQVIPVDERSYLTLEKDGRYFLWDQQDFPASEALAEIKASEAQKIMDGQPGGKRLIDKLYTAAAQRKTVPRSRDAASSVHPISERPSVR
jgi:hypothetical protein